MHANLQLPNDSAPAAHLSYRIADVDIAIEGPTNILSILANGCRRLPSASKDAPAQVTISLFRDDSAWIVMCGKQETKRLSIGAPPGNLALELGNALVLCVAERSRFLIVHGAALERDGKVVCLAGKSFSGKTLLTAHLASRGWRILSDEYLFIEPLSKRIVPYQKLLYMRSGSLGMLPRSFMKALERSPWHASPQSETIVFHAVDPADSYGTSVWGDNGRLTHFLLIENDRAGVSKVTEANAWTLMPQLNTLVWQPPDLLGGLTRLANAVIGTRIGTLQVSSPLNTTDVIEEWTLESAVQTGLQVA
ncbi:MAG: hypothetical protein M3126_03010 [Candidatus Eremiobacteraeota bacterium]|nr:hypothetical protein [Candidatus Eremiobacteraeota bacterium]